VHTGVVGKSEGKNHLEDLDINRRLILRWYFKKYDGGMDLIVWFRISTSPGFCEHGHGPSYSIKLQHFLD